MGQKAVCAVANAQKAEVVLISHAYISGILPEFDSPALRDLELEKNNFTGSIPSFQGCPQLRHLKLGKNKLTELAPPAAFPGSLETLDLSHNYFDIGKFKAFEDEIKNTSLRQCVVKGRGSQHTGKTVRGGGVLKKCSSALGSAKQRLVL
jgi:hypothetical protein